MANTAKGVSRQNALQIALNDKDASLAVSGFLAAVVGRKVELAINSAVETYTFKENGTTLYVITLTYTDSTRATLLSAERTA